MPVSADRESQRALLQEQWDSLDDLTSRLSQRVREKPNRDLEDGPGHLPDPNVAQELILTRGRLASVERERDRLERRLQATREKLRTLRTELRKERRQLERLGGVSAPRARRAASMAVRDEATGAASRSVQPSLHVVHDECELEFEGAPMSDAGLEVVEPDLVAEAQLDAVAAGPEHLAVEHSEGAAEAELVAGMEELSAAVAELDDVATVLTAAEAELTDPGAAAEAEAQTARPEPNRAMHWSTRVLFERISARWRDRTGRD